MSPLLSNTMPEPSPLDVSICTTDGSTLCTAATYALCNAAAPPPLLAGAVVGVAPPVAAVRFGLVGVLLHEARTRAAVSPPTMGSARDTRETRGITPRTVRRRSFRFGDAECRWPG